MTDKFHFFQGLDLLKTDSLLREEAKHLQTEGLEKIEVAVAGSEAEGLYGLLRGTISHSSMSCGPTLPRRAHHTPITTISHPPPQEPKGAVPEASDPVTEGVKQALEAVSPTAPNTLEAAISAHMTPLHLGLGAPKGSISARGGFQ